MCSSDLVPPGEVEDPFEKNEPGKGVGRDPERTPMQWDSSPNAGFTSNRPWLRLAEDWPSRNVATLERDPRSILGLYRRLIELRRRHVALTAGSCEPVSTDGQLFAFARVHGAERLLIAANFSAEPMAIPAAIRSAGASVLLSTYLDRDGALEDWRLRPNEALLVAIE